MSQETNLQDFKINVKLKLAVLWVAVMFCYVYGDYFLLMVPGHIQNLINGKSGVGQTTPLSLLLFSVLMTIPSLMIFLSVMLAAKINRVANIIFGILFTAIMLLIAVTSTEEWLMFYVYLAIVESCITSLIVWQALQWPKQEN